MKYKDKEYLYNELVVKQIGVMQVAKDAGCTYITLVKWCKKFGIPLKSKTKMAVDKLGDKIINLYVNEHMLEKDIALELSTTVHIVRKTLEYRDIEKRSLIESNRLTREKEGYVTNRIHALNENFFDEWTSDMSYILGLIASDGAITKGKKSFSKWKIALKKDEDNINLLEQIRNIINYEGNLLYGFGKSGVGNKVYENVTLPIHSKKMVDKLFEYGITNQKSMVIEMPIGIPDEFKLDFIRGYFDGDGSIAITYPTNKKRFKTLTPQLRLRIVSGNRVILEQFSEVISSMSDIRLKHVSQRKANLYELEYSTLDSIKIYNMMYSESCLSLERKRLIFENCINIRNGNC